MVIFLFLQINDILSLKSEVKQLQSLAQQIEPFIKSFTSSVNTGEANVTASDATNHQHLQVLLEHLTRIQMQEPTQPAPTKDSRQQVQPHYQQASIVNLELQNNQAILDNDSHNKGNICPKLKNISYLFVTNKSCYFFSLGSSKNHKFGKYIIFYSIPIFDFQIKYVEFPRYSCF